MQESKSDMATAKTHGNSFIEVLDDAPTILYVNNELSDLKLLQSHFEDEIEFLKH